MGNTYENNNKSQSLDSSKKFILRDVDNLKKTDTDRQSQISRGTKHDQKRKKKREFLLTCPCLHLLKNENISYQTCQVSIFL